jgi:hypothetical protein
VINNHVHPISQHGPFRNNLNCCRRWSNRWHLLHHVLPLQELGTSDLKHKIDYTQTRTQPRSKLKDVCIWKDAYRKVGALLEHTVKILLYDCSVPISEDMTIQAIHPPCAWDSHCSVVWALKHGYCLRGDRVRQNGWLLLYDTQPKSLVAKNYAKTVHVATGGGGYVRRPMTTNDQSNIYHF